MNILDMTEFSALHIAIEAGHYFVVKVLLAAGAEWSRKELEIATWKGYVEMMIELAQDGANIRSYNPDAILYKHSTAHFYFEVQPCGSYGRACKFWG